MQVLYRKYRPRRFEEVVGQDHVVRILTNAIGQGRIAHAYLFSGPRGTGKTSVARIFARAVNCEKRGCGSCERCEEFLTGRTLDLVEMDAASNRGVDEVRAIREAAQLLPARATYKVYILDEAHMLTKEAWNALLKILEEPPTHVIFVLATTEAEKIPETIQSRVQHLRFRLMDDATLTAALTRVAAAEGLRIDPDAAAMLALFAEGSLRDALNLLGQIRSIAGAEITARSVEDFWGAPSKAAIVGIGAALAARDAGAAIERAGQIFARGAESRLFLKLLLHHFRTEFLDAIRVGRKEKDAAHPFDARELELILKILLDTATERHYSSWRELPVELALHRIVRALAS